MSIFKTESNYIAAVVATYWFVSISMVYLNKALMSGENVSIPAPLFVTWFQCVITALICWVAGEVGNRMKKQEYSAVATQEDGGDPTSDDSSKACFSAQSGLCRHDHL